MPDATVARSIITDLIQAGVDERHMHAIARKGTRMGYVPKATLLQRTNFLLALGQGAAVGGMLGLMGGLIAMAFPVDDLVIAGSILLEWVLVGAGVGGTVFSLIGASASNEQVKRYQEAINQGQILMMMDVPDGRVQEVTQRVQKQYPSAQSETADRATPSV